MDAYIVHVPTLSSYALEVFTHSQDLI